MDARIVIRSKSERSVEVREYAGFSLASLLKEETFFLGVCFVVGYTRRRRDPPGVKRIVIRFCVSCDHRIFLFYSSSA